MINFEFLSPTKIIFGKDTEHSVGAVISGYNPKKVLLHYGTGSIKKNGLHDRVISSLTKADISYSELGGALPNPRLSLVRDGIKLCRDEGVDFILAVGGGSAIDSAKAIAAGVPYEGDVWDFYTSKAFPKNVLPLGVILTIAAAGSEASKGSVITNEEGLYKKPLNCDLTKPKFAIMNPELTLDLPWYQTACGIVDIMAHAMERYFTKVKNVELTDRLIEGLLKTVIRNAALLMENPRDYDARAEIMWAGTIAHNDLLNTGRMGDFASHLIEHELSGIYDVAHGAGLAVVFPAWMEYVYTYDVQRFAQFAARVWDVDPDYFSPEWTALEGIRRLKMFYSSIGMPITLKELGIHDDRLEEMAQKATISDTKVLGNFIPIQKKDVLEILRLTAR